jgi:hypothetical protein
MKKKSMKGISRIDSGSTHGWFVRGYRNSQTYAKLFSDGQLGGKTKALVAARAFRDALHDELTGIPKVSRGRRLVLDDKRNKTGVIGVSKVVGRNARGKPAARYTVSWRPAPGLQKSTSFSVNKYGELKAFDLAVALRRKMLRKTYGRNVNEVIRKLKRKPSKVHFV